MARTSTGMCGTAWAPSSSTRAFTRRAASTILRTGFTVPSALETWDMDQLRLRSEQLFKFVQQKLARIVDGSHSQIRTLLLAKNLPRDDIGVMLHGGDNDLVSVANVGASPRLGHEVDALGGSAHKNNFPGIGGVQKPLHGRARFFVTCRSFFGESVHAAMA